MLRTTKMRTTPFRPTSIDLFCGAGGLTSSLETAGFDTVAAVDFDRDAIETLRASQSKRIAVAGNPGRHHLEGTRILCEDITKVGRGDVVPVDVDRSWTPDLLVGGPPCQPFSSAGRRLALEDPRGRLFHEFVRLADELNPRMILFENVQGLVTARDASGNPGTVLKLIQESFEGIGYACRFELLNAADYGAAQRRVRLFMIASRRVPLPEFPDVSHSKEATDGVLPWVSLRSKLAELPTPSAADVVRPKGTRASELEALLPGTGLKTGGVIENNRPGGHWGYRQDCFLADLDLPSRTIRAATTPDWIRDEGHLRRLTWRECAALQGFPSEWEFVGGSASRFRQIGNAVQGDVGLAVGRMLKSAVKEIVEGKGAPISAPWPSAFHRRVRYTEMEQIVNGEHRIGVRRSSGSTRSHASG